MVAYPSEAPIFMDARYPTCPRQDATARNSRTPARRRPGGGVRMGSGLRPIRIGPQPCSHEPVAPATVRQAVIELPRLQVQLSYWGFPIPQPHPTYGTPGIPDVPTNRQPGPLTPNPPLYVHYRHSGAIPRMLHYADHGSDRLAGAKNGVLTTLPRGSSSRHPSHTDG